ncbi:DUF1330 domain-containing protein [Rubrivirga sp.]|uniref:DUF1330 domain-containing protein n=1 Tax=Rubrivirga sp. TaxID=1885344 RepID=UPI003C74AFCA
MSTHIDPAPEGIAAFLARDLDAPVVMLNLLRFRETADYSSCPDLDPGLEVGGRDAYATYLEHTAPFVARYGGEMLVRGSGSRFLIGPAEGWDEVLLVRYPSSRAFLEFSQDPGYFEGAGHRTAALKDSRLLPLDEAR